jgi:transcription initiation factor IIF auxiliary subunit
LAEAANGARDEFWGERGAAAVSQETTRRIPDDDYPDGTAYEWTLEIKGASHELDTIDSVGYTLHPTFHSQPQKVRARETGFGLTRVGWGTFTVGIQIEFIDHTAVDGAYALTFEDQHEALLVARP